MGADLIGYSIAMPAGKNSGVFVDKEIARLRKGLAKFGPDSKPSDICKALGLSAWDYDNDMGGYDNVDMIPSGDFYSEVQSDIALADDFSEELGTRDSYCRTINVGGRKVATVFAGELSWGDTPDGAGYQTLRAMWRLGIGRKLEDMLRAKR